MRGQQQPQRDRQRQHPLAHRHMGDDVVHQVSGGLCHAPGSARRAKAAPLAGEGYKLVVAAFAATQAQEAVGQDAAFEEGVELVLDKLRQIGAGCGLGLLEESRGMLLHQAVERGLLGAVALGVDRGAIGRPAGLRIDGLHALLMSGPWCFTVSNRAARRHCPLWCLLAGAHIKVSTASAGAAAAVWTAP